ncbi:MAG: hypothetical protein QM536_07065 [Chitinophagaceae bacterium]|nr:hypothetical protein [Chitinophagaceae bacterium]
MITDTILSSILLFLTNRAWQISEQTDRFTLLRPPIEFHFNEEFRLHIPRQINKINSERFIENILEIIADFYDLTIDDLNVVLKNENTVLKVRVYDDQTKQGIMSLTRFEGLVEKIKLILSDAASFVIDRTVTSTRVSEEVSKYLNLCNFMQTEKGSFVAKIQLPSKELIKHNGLELYGRQEISSEEINQKLREVLTFVKQNIFEFEGDTQVTEEYLIENETIINIKLFKDIESFFDKTNLKNIDFSFHNIANSDTIVNQDITPLKLHKLNQFVEQIESHSLEYGDFSFTGFITELKSRNPEGFRNNIAFTGIHNGIHMVASVKLDSENYKSAIEAHKLKKKITITGLAKRTKTRAKFIEIKGFEIQE